MAYITEETVKAQAEWQNRLSKFHLELEAKTDAQILRMIAVDLWMLKNPVPGEYS